ncbi:hypothetical protein BgAZ_109360 [Babesia gibsoni]|uniref:Uncharacterized protein n=1 Tax=Babesia gibsoni TaxID=33632 RepID=A0AAD8USM3_BABGI|nr:hypothetical protein BgAZ_109360 [Babesia gibsoni]
MTLPVIDSERQYSDHLESTGSSVEHHHEQHQEDDIQQLRKEDDDSLTKKANAEEIKPQSTVSQVEEVAVIISPVATLEGNEPNKSEGNLEPVKSTSISFSGLQEPEREGRGVYAYPPPKTEVAFDTINPIHTQVQATPTNPVSHKDSYHNYNTNSYAPIASLPMKKAPGERDLEENRRRIVDNGPVDGTVVIEKVFSPVNEVGKWCLLAQIVLSVLFLVMCLLIVLLDFGQDIRVFVILYPFLVYFAIRVLVVAAGDFILEKYFLVHYPQIAAVAHATRQTQKARMISGAVNNLCLILAVVSAILPYGKPFGSMDPPSVKILYFSLIALIHCTIFLATALHYGMIRGTKKRTNVLN